MRITNVETHTTLFIFCTNGVEKQFVRGGKVPLGQHQRDVVRVRKSKKSDGEKNGLNGKHDEMNEKHHFQGIWDNAIKIKMRRDGHLTVPTQEFPVSLSLGVKHQLPPTPVLPIILCGASDLVAELINQHLQVQVSSPPPASRMHLSGGVAGQRPTTRLSPVMCGVPLCVKTRWPEGSEGKWWRKASTGAQGQVIFAKGYQQAKHTGAPDSCQRQKKHFTWIITVLIIILKHSSVRTGAVISVGQDLPQQHVQDSVRSCCT